MCMTDIYTKIKSELLSGQLNGVYTYNLSVFLSCCIAWQCFATHKLVVFSFGQHSVHFGDCMWKNWNLI